MKATNDHTNPPKSRETMTRRIWASVKRQLKRNRVALSLYAAWLAYRASWRFKQDFRRFKQLSSKQERFSIRKEDLYPCLTDNTATTHIDRHYVYHTAWAARVLASTTPREHVDISSYVYFSTIVSAFMPMRFYDYRPIALGLDNLCSDFANLISLPFESGSLHSLSCMHVIEHIGLGRYGDRLDPDGDLKAIAELKRVLAPGGQLLFVVPVGEPRIQFNAHRIYACDQVISYFGEFELEEFALIPDHGEQGGLIRHATVLRAAGLRYGCGCFHFRKSIK